MRIGILGSGLMGGKLGTLFARAGHEMVFSYARYSRRLFCKHGGICDKSARRRRRERNPL
jgi:ketopantoate reductase